MPVSTIGYPTIKSVQYKDGALTLDKLTRELAENPTDVKLREALDERSRTSRRALPIRRRTQ